MPPSSAISQSRPSTNTAVSHRRTRKSRQPSTTTKASRQICHIAAHYEAAAAFFTRPGTTNPSDARAVTSSTPRATSDMADGAIRTIALRLVPRPLRAFAGCVAFAFVCSKSKPTPRNLSPWLRLHSQIFSLHGRGTSVSEV